MGVGTHVGLNGDVDVEISSSLVSSLLHLCLYGVVRDLDAISNCLSCYLLSVSPLLSQRDAHVSFQWFATQTFNLPWRSAFFDVLILIYREFMNTINSRTKKKLDATMFIRSCQSSGLMGMSVGTLAPCAEATLFREVRPRTCLV